MKIVSSGKKDILQMQLVLGFKGPGMGFSEILRKALDSPKSMKEWFGSVLPKR